MIVTCPSCQTRFRLASDRIGPAGARIRCSVCKAIFRLAASGEVSPDEAAQPLPDPPGPPSTQTIGTGSSGFAPARAGDPFAPPPRGSPSPSVDPFAASAIDPFTAALGPDPFSPGAAAPRPSEVQGAGSALQAALSSVPAAAAGPVAVLPSYVDPDALSLEEAPPRPRLAPPPLPVRSPTAATDLARADGAIQAVEEARGEEELTFGTASEPAPASPLLAALDFAAPPEAAPPLPAAPAADPAPYPATSALPRMRRRTGLAAVVANSLSLALLLALTAGLLSWRGGLGRRARAALGVGGAAAVEPVRVRAGLYETAAGPQVLVVRGEVRAHRPVAGPLRVRVALVEGARTVATAEALAGATASPEDVFALATAGDASSLRRALDARAAKALPSGGRAPFLVVFPAPLPEPSGLEVRTVASAASEPRGP